MISTPMFQFSPVALVAGFSLSVAQPALAKNVKVTPIGSHDGEFCRFDRAMILEDPDGTRLLYDAGRTVAGPNDPRLGRIDVVLVSHMHGDHVADHHIERVNAGECGEPDKPTAVIVSHANEAATKGGKVIISTRTDTFIKATRVPVYIPLSGRTMEFDSSGQCVAGC